MIRRVLMVDDMPLAVEGLLHMLEAHFGEDVWFLPCNGAKAALRISRTVRIDVLVTDVQMPATDGLALHREIQKLWPQVRTVFLSAHNDPEYIREAIRCDGVDYVLKSEDDSTLVSAVERALDLVNEQQRIRATLERMKDTLREFSKPIVNEVLRGALRGRVPAESVERWPEIRLGIEPRKPFFVILSAADGVLPPASGHAADSWHEYLNQSVHNYLGDRFQSEQVQFDDRHSVLMLQPREEQPHAEDYRYLYESLDLVQNACLSLTEAKVSFAIGSRPVTLADAGDVLRKLFTLIESAARVSNLAIISDTHFDNHSLEVDDAYDPVPQVVREAEAYVRGHIDNQVSAARVAEEVQLNPSYFSRLYKEARGETLQHYIARMRTERAKELLSSTRLSTAEIAKEVGLSTASYFSVFFKRQTGQTPNQFRGE